ncbi:NAD-dependent epimerase/dehydratase family protein [Nocardia transvalensis]|uniref:NAD-dependent epimerase/dehydratase family protein n=1 Tax=Nocardia transvalensis TaxID=37333 RepID=UPI001894F4BE|nr:NAD(P)-dependent oxidoreductase [Nocardia transvalensis]MBF6328594.1 NAD(P)-dependent oxidoreductase [Nocardia transvalensis]
MRILLAGATGTIGSALVPQLLSAGHSVLGLTRNPAGAERLAGLGVRPVIADMMNADALLAAVAGLRADAVVHQATALTRTPTRHRDLYATDALRDEGTRNLLRAARIVGAERFVTQSFFLGYGWKDHGSTPLTEDRPFAQLGRGPYDRHLRSLRSNEDQVLGFGGIALRYGLFYGPEQSTFGLMDSLRRRKLPVPRHASNLHPIHIADAAAATVAALERGRPGQAYNIADDEPVDMGDYLDALAAIAGAPAPRRVPGWLLRATPYLHGLLVGTHIRLDTTEARRELGWTPQYPTYRDGFAALDTTSAPAHRTQ